MIEVEEVPLDIQLPINSVGMVLMQPFIELDLAQEPFKWQASEVGAQLERIKTTLALARGGSGLAAVNFTVFPEYSIPGLEGVTVIQDVLSEGSWPSDSVIIAGVDGLAKRDYGLLCESGSVQTSVHPTNHPDRLKDHEWVNCCVTWVNSQHSGLRRWIQPKLAPARLEKNVDSSMYRGQAAYVFRCKFQNTAESRFLSLVCFDWIDKQSGLWTVLNQYAQSSASTHEIHFIFVLQHNDKPNDNLFLENARRYFEEHNTCPTLNRIHGALIFANTAGGIAPGKYQEFGFSSLVFHPGTNKSYDRNDCPPTFAIDTNRLRGRDNLKGCPQSLLREMGSCVHSFALRLPRWIDPNPGDRGHPLEKAHVFRLDNGGEDDPRLPGGPVSAIVKWFNDNLGRADSLILDKDHPLNKAFKECRKEVVDETRKLPVEALRRSIDMLSVKIGQGKSVDDSSGGVTARKWIRIAGKRPVHNVDNWEAEDEECLKFLVNSLSVLKLCKPVQIADSQTHARMRIGNNVYDIVVVCGPSHEECDMQIDRIPYFASAARTLIAFTVDLRHQRRRLARAKDITDPTDPSARDILSGARRFYSCIDLIDAVGQANDLAGLCDKIDKVLNL